MCVSFEMKGEGIVFGSFAFIFTKTNLYESRLMFKLSQTVWCVFLYSTIPGGAGGIASFLLAVRNGHYRNNKYVVKFSVEFFGAMLTASFLIGLLSISNYQITAAFAFAIGIAWAKILQAIRSKITKIVESALGGPPDKGDK